MFPFVGDGELHELESEEVVHVHALRPALLVTNLGLVLQVTDDLGLARKCPEKKYVCYMNFFKIYIFNFFISTSFLIP